MAARLLALASRRGRRVLAALALIALAGLLVASLAPVDGRIDRLAPDGDVARAVETERESFGGDVALVVVRGDMVQTLRSADLVVLAGLEYCLSGVPNPDAKGPCERLRDLKAVEQVLGPGTFANSSLAQIQQAAQSRLTPALAEADEARRRAEEAAKKAGASAAEIEEVGQNARLRVLLKAYGEALEFAEQLGLTAETSLADPEFAKQLFFAKGDDGKYGPKRRLEWLIPNRQTALIQVRLRSDIDAGTRNAAISALRDVVAHPAFRLAATDATLEFTGLAPVTQELADAVSRSLYVLTGAALAVMALVLLLARRLRRRLLPVLVAAAVIGVATIALTAPSGEVSLALVVALPVLVGIAVDQAVQAQLRLQRRLAPAALRTLVIAGGASSVSALALLASPFALVRTVGLAVAGAVLVSILLAALAAAAVARRGRAAGEAGDETAGVGAGARRGGDPAASGAAARQPADETRLEGATADGGSDGAATARRDKGLKRAGRRGAAGASTARLQRGLALPLRAVAAAGRAVAAVGRAIGGALGSAGAALAPAAADADELVAGSPPVRGVLAAARGAAATVSRIGRPAAVAVLVVAAALAAAGLAVGTKSDVQTGVTDLVPRDSQAVTQLERLRAQAGTSGQLSLVVRTRNVGDPALWRWLVQVQRRVAPGEARCDGRRLCVPLPLDELFGTEPGGALPSDQRIAERLAALPETLARSLVDADRGVVTLAFGTGELDGEAQRAQVSQLRAALGGAPRGVEASVSGLAAIADAGADALEDTGRRVLLWVLALALPALLLLAVTRSPRRVLVAIVPPALALGWSELVLWAAGIDRSPLTAALAVLVAAIAVEFSVLLGERFAALRRVGLPRERAIDATLRETGGAVAISAGATVAGFAVLALASIPLIAGFGAATAIDLLLVLLALGVVAPALWVLTDRTPTTGTPTPRSATSPR